MPKLKGFTLIKLLVVIAVIALLMAILTPSLQRIKEQTREMACRTNMCQYCIAQTIYLDDHDYSMPVFAYYNYSMNIYLGSKSASSGGGVQRLGSALVKEV